jgi:hypothetical protein
MKTKKFKKKLQLNKKTVVDLNGPEMNGVHGGAECDSIKSSCIFTLCGGSCAETACCPTHTCETNCGTCPSACTIGACC